MKNVASVFADLEDFDAARLSRILSGFEAWTCPQCGTEIMIPKGRDRALPPDCGSCGYGTPTWRRPSAQSVENLPKRFRGEMKPRCDALEVEALSWAKQSSLPSLVLRGESQHGKSHLAAYIARWRARNLGEPWAWVPSVELAMTGFERLAPLIRVEGLVVDDLGLGHDQPSFWSRVSSIAVARADAERPTIYTTRLTWKDIEMRDTSIANRLRKSRATWVILEKTWDFKEAT